MVLAASEIDEFIIPRVFVAIAAVIVVARLMGLLAKRLRQPPVVGEIVGGILLGPTLLGALPGGLDTHLFPLEIRPFLTVIANLGLIIFMFIVGLELDTSLIKGKERVAGVVSLASIILPLGLGIALATHLHDAHGVVDTVEVEFVPFALFIGASMSITAFPVLARIMIDRGMYRTQLGALTLACAAVDDVLAWSLLAVVLAVIETGTFLSWDFPRILGLALAFGAGTALVVAPLLRRLVPMYWRAGRLTPDVAAVIMAGFLLSAFVTAEIGVHHILGAFAFGAAMPRRDAHAMNIEILERLEQLTVILLLPVFFVTTGLSVDVGALAASDFGSLALILLTACAGKFLGASIAARAQGVRPWRRAAVIGTLMNTRGLTELIILSVGREAGVLDDRLFTMLVVMAVVTTVITEPALRIFYPDKMLARDVAAAQETTAGNPVAYRVFVSVDDPAGSIGAVGLACRLVGEDRPSEVVLSRLVELDRASDLAVRTSARLAQMTASMEAMADLEREVLSRGIEARVFTRMSAEPASDLAAQVTATDSTIVLLVDHDRAASADAAASMASAVDRVVAVFAAPPPTAGARGVAVVADDSSAGAAAFELALRAALADATSLTMVVLGRKHRRWNDVCARLVAAGIDARVETDLPDASLVVTAGPLVGTSRSPRSGHLAVYAPPDLGLSTDDVLDAYVRRVPKTS